MQEFDGTFELVDPSDIHLDRKYQRDQKWGLIGAIAKNPRWAAFGVIICSKRTYAKGLLYALDGQQRLTGVQTSAEPPRHVPVVWFPVSTPKEEADLFDVINTNRKALASLEKFKARVTAENPMHLQIVAAVERAGFTIGKNQISPVTIPSVEALKDIYHAVGEEGVYVALAAWHAAWPDENAPTATLLKALGDVMSEMNGNGDVSTERLAKAMARTTPGRWMRKAEQLRYDLGGSKRAALRRAFKELAKL